jgi:hypothetical protein
MSYQIAGRPQQCSNEQRSRGAAMNNGHELRLDLAHARQRELIAAGERARMDGRSPRHGDKDAAAARSSTGGHPSRASWRVRLTGVMLRRARFSAVRDQGRC